MADLGLIGRVCLIIGNVFYFVVAFIHIYEASNKLHFTRSPAKFHEDFNSGFRGVFSLAPTTWTFHWSPFIFCFIPLFGQIQQLKWEFIMANYFRLAIFTCFTVIFACLGYAGGVGIICGILQACFAVLYFVISCVDSNANTSFEHPLPIRMPEGKTSPAK